MNAAGKVLVLMLGACCCQGKELPDEFTVAARQVEARFHGVSPAIEVTVSYHGSERVTASFDRAMKHYCHMESPGGGWRRQVINSGPVFFAFERGSPRDLIDGDSVQDIITPLLGLDYFTRITAGDFTIPITISLPVLWRDRFSQINLITNAKIHVSPEEARAYNDNRKKDELSQQFRSNARVLNTTSPDRLPDIEFTLTYIGEKPVTLLLDRPLTDCLCLAERDGGELWAWTDCEPHARSPGKASVVMYTGSQVSDVLHLENYYKRLVTGERPLRYHFRLHVAYEGTDFMLEPLDGGGKSVSINLTDEQVRAINQCADEWDRHH